MAKSDSVQKRLKQVRAPRVQMTYDVEIGDAIENKELPFVMGVLGDFGGNAEHEKKRLKDRKFVAIDMDNFDEVLGSVAPATRFDVDNRLSGEGGTEGATFSVDLQFRSMDDFRPESVVRQVAPLRKLLDARTKLADLRNKLAGNDKLEDLLTEVLNNTDSLATLKPRAAAQED